MQLPVFRLGIWAGFQQCAVVLSRRRRCARTRAIQLPCPARTRR